MGPQDRQYFISGGVDPDSLIYNSVLQYHAENDTWTTAGYMLTARYGHAVSVVRASDVSAFCN